LKNIQKKASTIQHESISQTNTFYFKDCLYKILLNTSRFLLFNRQKEKTIMAIEILLLTTILIILAVLALSIRLLVSKKAEFRGGSCANITPELREQGITCACDGDDNCAYEKEKVQ